MAFAGLPGQYRSCEHRRAANHPSDHGQCESRRAMSTDRRVGLLTGRQVGQARLRDRPSDRVAPSVRRRAGYSGQRCLHAGPYEGLERQGSRRGGVRHCLAAVHLFDRPLGGRFGLLSADLGSGARDRQRSCAGNNPVARRGERGGRACRRNLPDGKRLRAH